MAGIPIKKCCASCERRDDKIRMANEKRTCLLGQTEPDRILKCDRWRMRKKIMDMTLREGEIKSGKYFQYLLAIRSKERKLIEEHEKDNTKQLEDHAAPDIRKNIKSCYEACIVMNLTGSVFLRRY